MTTFSVQTNVSSYGQQWSEPKSASPTKLVKLALTLAAGLGYTPARAQAQNPLIFSNAQANKNLLASIEPIGGCAKARRSFDFDCFLKFKPQIVATSLQGSECANLKMTLEQQISKFPVRGTHEAQGRVLQVDTSPAFPSAQMKCLTMPSEVTGDVSLISTVPETDLIVSGTMPDTLTIPRVHILAMKLSETACVLLLREFSTMTATAQGLSQQFITTPSTPGGITIPKLDFSWELANTQLRCIDLKTNEGINHEEKA